MSECLLVYVGGVLTAFSKLLSVLSKTKCINPAMVGSITMSAHEVCHYCTKKVVITPLAI